MKKYIPAPVKETLKFTPEVPVNDSSTAQNKNWTWPSRNVKFDAAGDQPKIEDKAPGVVQRASGRGRLISGNHPRFGDESYHAEAAAKMS